MRLRKVKNAGAFLDDHQEYVIKEPERFIGSWKQAFGNDLPIHLEIGSGKGQFLLEMAKQNPKVNFIGLEKFDSVLIRILEKLLTNPVENLLLIHIDAREIDKIFAQGEIDCIYLNFSDPWPKSRKAKYRLTYPSYLDIYKQILIDQGLIKFKTDNYAFFEYSMMNFNHDQYFQIKTVSLDIDKEDILNIETEFETKFKSMGKSIYYLELIRLRREQ